MSETSRPALFDSRWKVIALLLPFILAGIDAPPWMAGLVGIGVILRWLMDRGKLVPWPKLLTLFLILVFCGLVYLLFGHFFSREAAAVLLLGIGTFKMLDYRELADFKFHFLIGLLLVFLRVLFVIELGWLAVISLATYALWESLLQSMKIQQKWLFEKTLLRSLPMAAVLFVVFPRYILPWAQERANGNSAAGFEADLNPGSHGQLMMDSTPIFRAIFDESQAALAPSKLYWRGVVLETSQGLHWKLQHRIVEAKDVIPNEGESAHHDKNSEKVSYKILLEPQSQDYFFSLDQVLQIKVGSLLLQANPGGIVRLSQAHLDTDRERTIAYAATSDLSPQHPRDALNDEQVNLQVPELEPAVAELVKNLAPPDSTAAERLKNLDRFFLNGGFHYSLKPGMYSGRQLGEFLLHRKLGFCEHFAGAYATLARAMKIPARVVLGFQGGSYNSLGHFWQVNALDAHAWVEVLLQNRWQRKDPTGLVSPLRVELGASDFFQLSPDELQFTLAHGYSGSAQNSFLQLLQRLKNYASYANYRWTLLVLDFDQERVRQELRQLFVQNSQACFEILGILLLGFLLITFLRRKPAPRSFIRQVFLELIQELGKNGEPTVTPQMAAQSLERALTQSHKFQNQEEKGELISLIGLLWKAYQLEVYQEVTPSLRQIKQLRHLWKRQRSKILRGLS